MKNNCGEEKSTHYFKKGIIMNFTDQKQKRRDKIVLKF